MSSLFTYRDGKKLNLEKIKNQFVVRKLPEDLREKPYGGMEQMSSASTRVECEEEKIEELMEQSRKEAVTHHAYEEMEGGSEFLITDRLFINFIKAPDEEEAGKFFGKYALEIVQKYSYTKYLVRLTNETGMNPVKLVVALTQAKNNVESAEHDLNMRFQRCLELPTDPAYIRQWHLHRKLSDSEVDPRSSARCEQAWQHLNGFGSEEVVVAIADDGCQLSHPDFNSPNKFVDWGYFEGESLITKLDFGADSEKMYQRRQNHGTACAGVVAAEIDGQLTVGAAPGCRLLPIKWESSGSSLFISDSKLFSALDFIADKADVFSNSWGSSPSSTWSSDVKNKIRELSESGGRRGKGIVLLWAAGNDNCPISHVTTTDIPYNTGWGRNGGWAGVKTSNVFSDDLAHLPGVMEVAALASTAKRSHYSNYGPGIDICAPTSNSHTYWRMSIKGRGVTTTTGRSTVTDGFGGTSSATPLVAGIAALTISANPQLTASEVISILKQTASKDLNMEGYPRTPPASYDPNPTWDVSPVKPFDDGAFVDKGLSDGSWSPWFGHGKVDAAAAVARAKEMGDDNTKTVKVERVANLPIPDDDPSGVSSRLFVGDNGRINILKIHVDIKHSYIGDLVVRLTSPNGSRVDLHNRAGESTIDLKTTFDETSAPELSSLIGQEARGTWELEVTDFAPRDEGELRNWSVEAELLSGNEVRIESVPGLNIPDNDSIGIADTINVPNDLAISDIRVDVDITHKWIGDLNVEISRSNGGPSVVLHSREGREAHDIQKSYGLSNEPDLAKFIGASAQGNWLLKVSDNAKRDVGKLNRWALTFH